MMSLYTFFFEYDGGTYISQVRAADKKTAVFKWAEEFNLQNKKEYSVIFEDDFHELLVKSVREDDPVLLNGLSQTWCVSLIHLEKSALLNLTETVETN